jgi:hypothetical protein
VWAVLPGPKKVKQEKFNIQQGTNHSYKVSGVRKRKAKAET